MKIEIAVKELSAALRSVTQGISKNKVEKSLPVLRNVMISAEERSGKLIYTNLDQRIEKNLSIISFEDGKVLIPRVLFERVLKFLSPAANLTISTSETTTTIKSGNAEFELRYQCPPEDYPAAAEIGLSRILTMPGKTLAAMLKHVIASIRLDDCRKVLHGALFEGESENILCIVGTDGKRCARSRMPVENDVSGLRIIIPHEAVKKIIQLFERTEDNVKINLGIDKPLAQFSDGNIVFTTKTIEGNYPEYRNIFPAGYKYSIEINRRELLRKVEAMALLGKSAFSTAFVSLCFGENLKLSMIVDGNKFSDSMNVSAENLPEENYAFNAVMLAAGLKSCTDEKIRMLCNNAMSPVLLDGENFEYLIMPMRNR